MKTFYTVVDTAAKKFVYLDFGSDFCWDAKMPRRSASTYDPAKAQALLKRYRRVLKENIRHVAGMHPKNWPFYNYKELRAAKLKVVKVTFKVQ